MRGSKTCLALLIGLILASTGMAQPTFNIIERVLMVESPHDR
jgi:hypothetical protein